MTKQRLAIIGKGLVATAIAKQASPTYGSVTLVSRNKPLELDQLPERVTHIQGNALYPSSFSDTIRAADAVVSTVGTLKEGKDKDRTFERVNRDAVVSVAREMVKTQPAHLDKRCLVYFSFANAPPAFLLDPRYVNSKREAEDALLSQEFKDALRVVIFRPGKSIAQAGEDSTHGIDILCRSHLLYDSEKVHTAHSSRVHDHVGCTAAVPQFSARWRQVSRRQAFV